MTLGVEEEFLVVDASTGALVPRAHDLLGAVEGRPIEDLVAPELNLCQIETATPVCNTLDEVGQHLGALRTGLAAAGEFDGITIAASGTHPVTSWRDQDVDVSNQRFERMHAQYQVVCRQQVICGCHVHVGIPDPDLAIAVMGRVRPWLPVLLALSANSPFWHGSDTGYASYRMQIWSRWPTAVMPPTLADRDAFDALVDELSSIEAIGDATFLYWHVRPSVRWPTVEFRICDTMVEVDHAVAVAGLVRALAWTTVDEIERGVAPLEVRPEVIESATWRAARYGLDDRLVTPDGRSLLPAGDVVAELLAAVRPGLEIHGDTDRVGAAVDRILAGGNGAARQRASFAERNDTQDVVDALLAGTVGGRRGTLAPGA